MGQEILIALIGAAATIIAAWIGSRSTPTGPSTDPAVNSGRRARIMRIVAVGLLALMVVLVGILIGAAEDRFHKQLENKALVGQLSQSYSEIIAAGVEAGNSYVIPSAVMLITLERAPDRIHVVSQRRIIYFLQAITDSVANTKPDNFQEFFHSDYSIARIPGSYPERNPATGEDMATQKKWDVMYDQEKGMRYTVVTGIQADLPLRLKDSHDLHQFTNMRSNEDAYCYPNDAGDIIEQFTIMVQSSSMRLHFPDKEASNDASVYRAATRTSEPVDPGEYNNEGLNKRFVTLTARFANLHRGDIAGMKVAW